jgi:hypothetical protein
MLLLEFWLIAFVLPCLSVILARIFLSVWLQNTPHWLTKSRSSSLYFSSLLFVVCFLTLCFQWRLQVPHPLYRPAKNRLVPCADSLCTALYSGQGSNHKCSSPQQCDYRVEYTDKASSLGVLVSDKFTLTLTNSSNVRPSLTFGYSTLLKRCPVRFTAIQWLIPWCFLLFAQLWVWPASGKKRSGASSDRWNAWTWEGIN